MAETSLWRPGQSSADALFPHPEHLTDCWSEETAAALSQLVTNRQRRPRSTGNRTLRALGTLPSSGPSVHPEPILAVSAIEATATK